MADPINAAEQAAKDAAKQVGQVARKGKFLPFFIIGGIVVIAIVIAVIMH